MISEITARLLPPVLPNVEIHTSRFDIGEPELTSMTLWPGLSAVAGISTVVSANFAGVGVEAERISTLVPMLATSMVTALTTVGLGKCNINPTPFLKPGNGTASL